MSIETVSSSWRFKQLGDDILFSTLKYSVFFNIRGTQAIGDMNYKHYYIMDKQNTQLLYSSQNPNLQNGKYVYNCMDVNNVLNKFMPNNNNANLQIHNMIVLRSHYKVCCIILTLPSLKSQNTATTTTIKYIYWNNDIITEQDVIDICWSIVYRSQSITNMIRDCYFPDTDKHKWTMINLVEYNRKSKNILVNKENYIRDSKWLVKYNDIHNINRQFNREVPTCTIQAYAKEKPHVILKSCCSYSKELLFHDIASRVSKHTVEFFRHTPFVCEQFTKNDIVFQQSNIEIVAARAIEYNNMEIKYKIAYNAYAINETDAIDIMNQYIKLRTKCDGCCYCCVIL